jgi:2,3-dihydroxybiphenyl 1,2-dioxygenase
MELQALGYVGLNARNLDDWAGFGVNFLGMELVERTRSMLALRMDDRRQRLVIQSDDVPPFFGWEVADAAALGALAARLEAAGVRVERLPQALAGARRVAEAIAFADPLGNRLEAFHGAELAPDAFKPGRAISGFRTGPLGMGHVVVTVERIEDALWFYQDVLGFALSDYMLKPFKIYFFHVNPRHHSFAVLETGRNGIHHLMVELFMLDDVGQAYDLALPEERRIAATLGRHTNDYMTSFYSRTPSDFLVEYGWGGRSIDPKNWTPVEMTHGPSLWGHERAWIPADELAEARKMRAGAALEGQRAPVQVIEGNYTLAPGTCPWWDATKARRPA